MCPKSYHAVCHDRVASDARDATKTATKGVSKLTNVFEYDQYSEVVYDARKFDVINYSIRLKDGEMRTMKINKIGLNGVHIKNFVQEDRVTTIPHIKHRHL